MRTRNDKTGQDNAEKGNGNPPQQQDMTGKGGDQLPRRREGMGRLLRFLLRFVVGVVVRVIVVLCFLVFVGIVIWIVPRCEFNLGQMNLTDSFDKPQEAFQDSRDGNDKVHEHSYQGILLRLPCEQLIGKERGEMNQGGCHI